MIDATYPCSCHSVSTCKSLTVYVFPLLVTFTKSASLAKLIASQVASATVATKLKTLRTLSWSKASWKTRFDVIESGLTDGLDWDKFGRSFATWLAMKLAIAQIPSARVGSMSSDAYLFTVQNGTQ